MLYFAKTYAFMVFMADVDLHSQRSSAFPPLLLDLQAVSTVYFFVFGSIYFCLALFFHNGYEGPYIYTFFNILDIPFALASLLYAGTSLKLSFLENDIHSRLWDILLLALGLILFLLVLYVNFLLY